MRCVAAALALVALVAVPAGAVDVVVFDRGGGAARVATVAEAVVAGGDVVLSAADTAALDAAYAAACADASCYARAGAAGGVAQVILVEGEVLRVINVAAAERRLFAADPAAVRDGLQALRTGKLGRLDTSAVSGARLIVDGNEYRGEDLVAGTHIVDIYGADGRAVVVDVDVPAGGVGVVPPLPTSSAAALVAPATPSSSLFVPTAVVAGGGVFLLAAGGLGLANLNAYANDAGTPKDPEAAQRTYTVLEPVAWALAGVGVIGVAAGATLLLLE